MCYKQSAVVNESLNDLLNLLQGSFGQWSADHIDHNVRTLDGKDTLHADWNYCFHNRRYKMLRCFTYLKTAK